MLMRSPGHSGLAMTTRSLSLLLLAAAAGLSCSQQDFVTDVPLRVVSITSTHGSVTTRTAPDADAGLTAPVVDTFVPRDTDLEITFSERLAGGTVQGAITLEALGPTGTDPDTAVPTPIPVSVTYKDAPVPTVTVTPVLNDERTKLPFSTALRLNISTSLKRLRDNGPLPVQVRWLASTVTPPPLRVVSMLPAGGATGLSRDTQVKVVFSEPLDCAELSGMAVSELPDPHPHTTAGGTAVAIPGQWECPAVDPESKEIQEGTACAKSPALCTVRFKPQDPAFRFKNSSEVTLQLSGGEAAAPVRSARATTAGGALQEDVTSSFRVVDPPVLALATAVPANGATGVSPNTGITLAFTEPVDCETLTNATAAVTQVVDDHPRFGTRKGTTETVPGTWNCVGNTTSAGEGEAACAGTNASNCQAVFTPAAGFTFEPSATLKVTVAGGAYTAGEAPTTRDRVESLRATTRGGQLQTAVTFQVRAADPSPLSVTLSTPGNDAQNVPASPPPQVEVQFSRLVACDSVSANTASATFTLPDNTVQNWPLDIQCTAGNDHITLVPLSSTPLPFGSTVTITLQGGTYTAGTRVLEAADATSYGGQLPGDAVLTFKTEEPPSLLLASALPSPGSTGSGLSEPIVLSFSEPVDCTSINGNTVLVEQTPAQMASGAPVPGKSAVPCTFTCPVGGDVRKAQCAHAPFSPSASVQVTLVGGTGTNTAIQSDAATATGGQLPVDMSWTYRAADPAPLAVVGTSPNGNPGNNVSANADVRFTFSRAVRCNSVAGRLTLVRDDTGAAVPGTLTCTNGTQVGPAVDGTVAIFTPSAPLEVLKRYRATAMAGIEPVDATLLGTASQGTLPSDVSTRFDVAFEPLQVLATTPAAGSQLAPLGSNVVLQFNQELSPTSLVPCTPASDKASCNVVVTRGATPFNWTSGTLATAALDVDGAPTYEGGTRRWTLDPSDAANAPYLDVATPYSVSVKGGAAGPVGTNGVSRLPVDYAVTFRTSSAQMVLAITPDDLASDVASTDPVCIDFVADVDASTLTAGGNQLTLAYTDAFGRTAALPLDAVTPYTLSGSSGNAANRVCFNLVSAPYACVPGEHRLRAGTTFTATVSTAVKVGGNTPAAPFSWSFTTRAPPALSGVRVANAVISESLVDGASEVPVNGAFTVTFAEPMEAASLTASNIKLVPLGNAPAVVTTLTTDGLASPRAVTLTTPNLGFKSSTVDGRYAVQLLGGTGGVTTASGHALETDVRVAFTTSPATVVTLSPPETQLTPNALVPLVADRALHLPSVTSDTLYATLAGNRINGIVALQPAQPRAATYIPNPTWLTNNGGPYVVRTTTALLDFRGSPVPATNSQNFSTGNTPANNAIQPSLLTSAGNVAQVANSQSFVVTLGGTGLKERVLSTSWYSVAGGGGSISLEALGGAGCPQTATKLAVDSVLAPAATTAATDKVNVKVLPPLYMATGCQYALKVRQSQAANLYNQGNQGPEISFNAVGESVAPTLGALEVQKPDGTFAALTGSAVASGKVVVRATFSEPLAASSVTALSFRVADTVAAVPGTLSVSGAVVTWTAAASVAAGTNLTATLGTGLSDLAGNAFGGTAQTFTVESTTPNFTAVSWSGTSTRDAPYGTATLTFTEPVDPATLHCNTVGAVGSLSFMVGANKLYGCAVLSGTNANEVLWRPADPVGTQVTVDVTTNPAGASPELKDLAGTAVPLTTRSFTTP